MDPVVGEVGDVLIIERFWVKPEIMLSSLKKKKFSASSRSSRLQFKFLSML